MTKERNEMRKAIREEMIRELEEMAVTNTAATTTAVGDDKNVTSLHFLRTAAIQNHQEDITLITSQLNTEWAARLRQEVDAAWQQSSLVSEAKLAKLEQLARDNERVLSKQLEERMNRRLDSETAKFLSIHQRLETIAAEDVVRAKQAGTVSC